MLRNDMDHGPKEGQFPIIIILFFSFKKNYTRSHKK